MAETTELEFENLNDVVQFLDKNLGTMTWTGIALVVDMDHGAIKKWKDHGVVATNIFLVQCLADVLGYDTSLRVRHEDKVLLETRNHRELGKLFQHRRELKGIDSKDAVSLITTTPKTLREFESGRKETEEARALGFDRIQALGNALELRVTVVLFPRPETPKRLQLLKRPTYHPVVRREGTKQDASMRQAC